MAKSIESRLRHKQNQEPLVIPASESVGLMLGIHIAGHSLVKTAEKYNFRTKNGSRYDDPNKLVVICDCATCVEAQQKPVRADNYPHAVELLHTRHFKMKNRANPVLRTVKQRPEQPKHPQKTNERVHSTYKRREQPEREKIPFELPHEKFSEEDRSNVNYTVISELLMKGIKPSYIAKHFTVAPGRAQLHFEAAVEKPITYSILIQKLRHHGAESLEDLKKCYHIPGDVLAKVLKKLGK